MSHLKKPGRFEQRRYSRNEIVTNINSLMDRLKSKLDTAEGRIGDMEKRTEEII